MCDDKISSLATGVVLTSIEAGAEAAAGEWTGASLKTAEDHLISDQSLAWPHGLIVPSKPTCLRAWLCAPEHGSTASFATYLPIPRSEDARCGDVHTPNESTTAPDHDTTLIW